MFNEEDNVAPMHETIAKAMNGVCAWELIFVNDGSSDATIERLIGVNAEDPRVRVVDLRRNYGQTPAVVAGIQESRGEIIVTLDGDLQNDPADIPTLLAKIEDGYDIVVGWRKDRQDDLILRKIPSWIANRMIGWITGVRIKDNGCSLKAYRSTVIQNIPLYSEMHRFIPAMTSLAGPRLLEIPVNHHARVHGTSKYGLARIYKVLLDIVVIKTLMSCRSRPLVFFATLAFLPLMVGFVCLLATFNSLVAGDGTLVMLGASLLWIFFAISSVGWGIVAELTHALRDEKESSFARLTARVDAS